MSLEQEIAALTQATNRLTETTLQSMKMAQTALNEAQSQFDARFILAPLTIEVGPTRYYTSIQKAWDFLTTKIILAPVRIHIDAGFYAESPRFSNQPYAHQISIIGAGKGQTVIQNPFEDNVWIILCLNVRGLTLGGMTLRGHYTSADPKLRENITHGLGADDNSKIYIQTGTLAIDYCWAGLCVYKNSGIIAHEIEVSHCRYGVVSDGGYANIVKANLRGLGRNAVEGIGITSANGSTVIAHEATVYEFPCGYDAERSSTMDAYLAQAHDCETGFRTAFSANLFAHGSRVENAYHGYLSEFNSALYAADSQAQSCDHGYLSRCNSCLHANNSSATRCTVAFRAEVMGYLEAFQTTAQSKNNTTLYSPAQYAIPGNENAVMRWS